MTSVSQNSGISDAVCDVLDKTRLYNLDFEGSAAATEVVMQISFVKLIEDHGITAEQFGDIYAVEKLMVGKTVRNIVDMLRTSYNLKGEEKYIQQFKEKCRLEGLDEKDFDIDLEALLLERQQAYDDLVREYKIGTSPFTIPMIRQAKKNHAIVVVISNGTDAIIREVLERDGLVIKGGKNDKDNAPIDINHIYASDSPERLEIEKKIIAERFKKELPENLPHFDPSCAHCVEENKAIKEKILKEVVGKKDYFLAYLSEKWDILPHQITVLEDNPPAFTKNDTALKNVWEKAYKDVTSIKGIKKIGVWHELNLHKEFPNGMDAMVEGPAPEELCWRFGVVTYPVRKALRDMFAGVSQKTL